MPNQRQSFVFSSKKHQQGISLIVILVVVMLAMLLALWAARSALFNQIIVSNDADYQRAFSAAQAMLQDAELDILRMQPNGNNCVKNSSKPQVCRASGVLYPPTGAEEIGPLLSKLSALNISPDTPPCKDGLCSKRPDPQDFWNNDALLTNMLKDTVGARYGQYTGAKAATGTNEIGASGNSILNESGNGKKGAWYWIEVLPYSASATSGNLIAGNSTDILPLTIDPLVVYRITAIAYGRKSGTRVVLQQTFAPQKLKN